MIAKAQEDARKRQEEQAAANMMMAAEGGENESTPMMQEWKVTLRSKNNMSLLSYLRQK